MSALDNSISFISLIDPHSSRIAYSNRKHAHSDNIGQFCYQREEALPLCSTEPLVDYPNCAIENGLVAQECTDAFLLLHQNMAAGLLLFHSRSCPLPGQICRQKRIRCAVQNTGDSIPLGMLLQYMDGGVVILEVADTVEVRYISPASFPK